MIPFIVSWILTLVFVLFGALMLFLSWIISLPRQRDCAEPEPIVELLEPGWDAEIKISAQRERLKTLRQAGEQPTTVNPRLLQRLK